MQRIGNYARRGNKTQFYNIEPTMNYDVLQL